MAADGLWNQADVAGDEADGLLVFPIALLVIANLSVKFVMPFASFPAKFFTPYLLHPLLNPLPSFPIPYSLFPTA